MRRLADPAVLVTPSHLALLRSVCLVVATTLTATGNPEGDPLATLRREHPRLLFSDDQLAANRKAADSDPLRAELHRYLIQLAESQWKEKPIAHVLIGPRLLLLAALAVADEEPDLARLVIKGVRKSLPLAMEPYAPDGAYPEGPVYWGYGTRYNVYLLAALESALGTDFGLGGFPAFDRTALYRVQMASATGHSFNYADGR